MSNSHQLAMGLAAIRYTSGFFLGQWAVEKFILPERYLGIYKGLYFGFDPGVYGVYAIGAVQLIIVAAFVLGLQKRLSYGAVLIMHAVTTLVTHRQLLNPYEGANHLFTAAIPVLGALFCLYMVRDKDRMFVLGR